MQSLSATATAHISRTVTVLIKQSVKKKKSHLCLPSSLLSNYIMLEFRWRTEPLDIPFANLLPLSFYILHLHGKHVSLSDYI